MYEQGQITVRELFAAYLEGADAACIAVLSEAPLDATVQGVCNSALHALGYGLESCMFVVTHPHESDALDAHALAMLVEGLDPLCIVVADSPTASLLAQTYNQPVKTNAGNRVVGRDVVAFADIAQLLSSQEGKQTAWALFKTLPRYGMFNRKKR